ncbi:MAG: isochorismatase family protein [Burkholderiales bacterium]|nr:isochorismatase family protein [Burkholderiales bacterium]
MAVWDDVLTGLDRQVYEQFRGAKEFGNRPALVVVDVNYAFTGLKPEPILESIRTYHTSCGERAWKVLPRLQALIKSARQTGIPVIYSTGIDREVRGAGWANRARKAGLLAPLGEAELEQRRLGNRIVSEIQPQPGDVVIRKIGPSVFFGTPLNTLLNEMDIDTVIVTGTTTSGCVRATAVDAACLDFYVGIVEDCTFDRFEISHKVSLLDMHAKYGSVISMADAAGYFEAACGRARSGLVSAATSP